LGEAVRVCKPWRECAAFRNLHHGGTGGSLTGCRVKQEGRKQGDHSRGVGEQGKAASSGASAVTPPADKGRQIGDAFLANLVHPEYTLFPGSSSRGWISKPMFGIVMSGR
jgi:hypothetical protein